MTNRARIHECYKRLNGGNFYLDNGEYHNGSLILVPFYCSFSEMPTNNYIESSFWNFDALFQPQQHPARDAHDTFFISGNSHPQPPPSTLKTGSCRLSNSNFKQKN